MKLLLIRHGDPDYVHDSLTETGVREAELLAERIAPMDITEYHVSTMGRARQTAEATLRRAGRTAEAHDWMREFHTSIPVDHPGRETRYRIDEFKIWKKEMVDFTSELKACLVGKLDNGRYEFSPDFDKKFDGMDAEVAKLFGCGK